MEGLFVYPIDYMRISASTPAGRLRFCRLSIVFGVAPVMSIRRLCTRISNVSPPFLYTCGDFTTVKVLRRVGSGTGPAIDAPVRSAVSIICFADWSMTLWSYAFRRIRIRRPSEAVSAMRNNPFVSSDARRPTLPFTLVATP